MFWKMRPFCLGLNVLNLIRFEYWLRWNEADTRDVGAKCNAVAFISTIHRKHRKFYSIGQLRSSTSISLYFAPHHNRNINICGIKWMKCNVRNCICVSPMYCHTLYLEWFYLTVRQASWRYCIYGNIIRTMITFLFNIPKPESSHVNLIYLAYGVGTDIFWGNKVNTVVVDTRNSRCVWQNVSYMKSVG